MHQGRATERFDQIGQIVHRIRASTTFRGARCILQRLRDERHFLDLLRQFNRRECHLLDRPRAACLHHLADVKGLVVVHCGWQRDQNCRTTCAGQFGNG